MIYSIIRKSRNFTLGVYGNGTAACLTNHKTSKDIFVQGDDALDFFVLLAGYRVLWVS